MNPNYDFNNVPVLENINIKNATLENVTINGGSATAFSINDLNNVPLDLNNGLTVDGEYFGPIQIREVLSAFIKIKEIYPEIFV